jgi:hypothetical protein
MEMNCVADAEEFAPAWPAPRRKRSAEQCCYPTFESGIADEYVAMAGNQLLRKPENLISYVGGDGSSRGMLGYHLSFAVSF